MVTNWTEQMVTRWTERAVKLMVLALVMIIVVAAMGEGVHELWNWLMPGIFHLPSIGYWQGVGLLALSWLLFGGFGWLGRPGHRTRYRGRMAERWEQMSPEERSRFREGLRAHCGHQPGQAEGSQA